jgi:hypothetical protein
MKEWRYSFTVLDLGTRWRRVVSSGCYSPGERGPCSHWIGGRVGPTTGLDAVENEKNFLLLPAIEPQPFSP